MNKKITLMMAAIAGMACGASALADAGFAFTDRFGYEGTAQRFGTLDDALNGVNSIGTINIGNRDIRVGVANNDTTVANRTEMRGNWWYTTDTFYSPTQGRAGWGNTTGNTGIGFLQLFDAGAVTTTGVSMAFGDFDGTHFTSFSLSASGANANSSQFSRFSALSNNGDGGIWHTYAMNFTATGLEGLTIAPGVIESNNHPTGVSGSITGIFEITSLSGGQQGFYVLDLTLTMNNWAWANAALLTPQVSSDGGNTFFSGEFANSVFRTVPTPGAVALFGLAGLAAARRRRG